MRRGPDALWPSRFESSINDATHLPSLCPPSAYGPECVKTLRKIEVRASTLNLKFIGTFADVDFA